MSGASYGRESARQESAPPEREKAIDWKAVVAICVTVGLSVISATYIAGHRDGIIDDHEKRITKAEARIETQFTAFTDQAIRLARIEEQLKFINENLSRLVPPSKPATQR